MHGRSSDDLPAQLPAADSTPSRDAHRGPGHDDDQGFHARRDRSHARDRRRPFDEESDRERSSGPPPGLALDPPDEPAPDHPPEIPEGRLDADAIRLIARLRHMRHKAYFVGGCVRDLLLGQTPKDFDVATDAHPGEVRAIFRNCRLIGRRFRLAHVYFRGGKVIEVATFRKNPTEVAEDTGAPEADDLLITRDNVFGTAEEDAVRRDFTVNGLFYDVASGEVIDYVGGRADLEAHRIATIGDPEIRIREDPVRSLRAIRFASRLGFTIAPDCFEAMRRHAGELARCAPARVLEEIFKILRCGGSSRAFELLRACGALQVILPALTAALEGWDDTRRRAFFAHLSALDRLVRRGEDVSDAVLLGAIVMHLGARPGPGQAARGDSGSARGEPVDPHADDADAPAAGPDGGALASRDAEALLASLVQSSRLPRKVAERTRLAIHAQRMFHDPPRKKRRRGRGLAGQIYFVDAVQLLEITVEATGQGREQLERWKTMAHAGHGEGQHAEGGAGEGHGPARRGDRPRHGPGEQGDRPHDGRAEERPRAADKAEVPAEARKSHPRSESAQVEPDAGPDEGEGPEDSEAESDAGEGGPREIAAESPAGVGEGTGRRRKRRRGGRRRRRRGAGGSAEGGPNGDAPPSPAAAGGGGPSQD